MDTDFDRLKRVSEKAERKAQQSKYELTSALQDAVEILKELDPIKRKPWIEAQLRELFHSQGGKCAICRRELQWGQFQVDHKIPHSKGGGNEFANLQLTHPFCNRSKSNGVSLSGLLRYLEGRVMNL